LLLMCDRQDVGVSIGSGDEADGAADQPGMTKGGLPASVSNRPRIFIYDNYPGGIGFSQPLFTMHADLLAKTRAMISGCACERGCPSCVGPVGDTGPLAKLVALRIVDLLGRPALPDALEHASIDSPQRQWTAAPAALEGSAF
jgi:DEAD/DEAH box helicase domain-containing protein